MQIIYIEPAWKSPLSVQDLVRYPPQGYEFIAPGGRDEKLFKFLSKYDLSYRLQAFLGRFIPLQLVKNEIERLKSQPKGSVLTYSLCHLVLRKEPWILDMITELPYILAWSEKHSKKYKDKIKKTLCLDFCRKIICRVNKGKEAFLVTFGKEFEEKIEVIYWGVPPKNFEKQYIKEKVKILFVNSGNINTALHFYGKGGAEVIQAFRILSQKYDNIELLIRSGMPKSVKKEIMMLKEATAIDQPIPWSELEKEWMTADIFVLPNHINTPAQVLLDAISYELPVVTTNVWANCEFIEDGKTGFLVNNPRSRYFEEGPILRLSELEKEIVKGAQPEVVEVLVEKISLLIENEKLRRQMGRAGRWEIEHGKFSIKRRNEKLKRILDEATLTEEQK